MTRTLAQLKAECDDLGIDHSRLRGTEAHMDALRDTIAERDGTTETMLPQLEVMLAKDFKDTFDNESVPPWRGKQSMGYWNKSEWIAERKYDGCRFKMHFTEWTHRTTDRFNRPAIGGIYPWVRLDSRRRSERTYAYAEKSDNFPHFTLPHAFEARGVVSDPYDEKLRKLKGTVLDGEIIYPYTNVRTSGTVVSDPLQCSMVVSNSGPDESVDIQRKHGPAVYIVFDILFLAGRDVRGLAFQKRRELVEKTVKFLNHPSIQVSDFYSNDDAPESVTLQAFEAILAEGGEGVMLKNVFGTYEPGKRSKFMLKAKRFETHDVYIVGWKPGNEGFTGLVGAFETSEMQDGKLIPIAAVSAMPLKLRHEVTAEDGSLKVEYYGRCLEIKFQQANAKSGRGRHAQIVRWRDDISPLPYETVEAASGNDTLS